MATIHKRVEAKRGCGFRKPGGIYLVCDGIPSPCGRLPIPLDVCPCCGNGIKPSRGWTWVNGTALVAQRECTSSKSECASCALAEPPGRVGLLWVGGSFYPTPASFLREAIMLGVSRRIAAIPRDFKLGETWVWLAHRRAISKADGTETAGVFRMFRPQRIEYVVNGTETEEELNRMEERGFTLVEVEHAGETKPLEFAVSNGPEELDRFDGVDEGHH